LRLEYLKDSQVNGIKTYDFHLQKDIFSKTAKEEFCSDDKDCMGDGVFSISKCRNSNFFLILLIKHRSA